MKAIAPPNFIHGVRISDNVVVSFHSSQLVQMNFQAKPLQKNEQPQSEQSGQLKQLRDEPSSNPDQGSGVSTEPNSSTPQS
jgi:hypothetical protein